MGGVLFGPSVGISASRANDSTYWTREDNNIADRTDRLSVEQLVDDKATKVSGSDDSEVLEARHARDRFDVEKRLKEVERLRGWRRC